MSYTQTKTKIRNTRRLQTHACKRETLGAISEILETWGCKNTGTTKCKRVQTEHALCAFPSRCSTATVSHTTPTHALHKMPTHTKMEVKGKCAQHERHSKQTCNADLYNTISAWFGNVGPGRAGQHNVAEPISHASRRNAEDTSTQEKGNIHELTWAVCVTCCETHLRKPRHMKNQPCTLRTWPPIGDDLCEQPTTTGATCHT